MRGRFWNDGEHARHVLLNLSLDRLSPSGVSCASRFPHPDFRAIIRERIGANIYERRANTLVRGALSHSSNLPRTRPRRHRPSADSLQSTRNAARVSDLVHSAATFPLCGDAGAAGCPLADIRAHHCLSGYRAALTDGNSLRWRIRLERFARADCWRQHGWFGHWVVSYPSWRDGILLFVVNCRGDCLPVRQEIYLSIHRKTCPPLSWTSSG